MSSSMHFLIHSLPSSDVQLNEKLKELSEKFKNCASTGNIPALNQIKSIPVQECVVSNSHIALLLEDGRICRVAYSILHDRLEVANRDQSKPSSNKGNAPANSANPVNAPRLGARRGRLLRTSSSSRGRGSSGVIIGSRPLVPPQFVPEDLITQAQVVLQGKSRSLIIKELQRTNLDVNLAVNNLLSRDDEDAEEFDDGQEPYIQSEELMSLLDAGIHNDHNGVLIDAEAVFQDDVFNYSSLRMRSSGTARMSTGRINSSADRDGGAGAASSSADRDNLIRFRSDRASYTAGASNSVPSNSSRWLEYALRDSASASESGKHGGSLATNSGTSSSADSSQRKRNDTSCTSNPFYVSENLQFWPTDKKFVQMASLHSELIAISSTGQLCQWKWNEIEPYKCTISEGVTIYHPKILSLCLLNEKIYKLAASCIRATVLTESDKLASWMDDSLSPVAMKLEHAAQQFAEFQCKDRIINLFVCSLYSCVRLENGSIYWWGVPPFSHRKKLWEKLKTKSKKQKNNLILANEIQTGSQVCLRNSPSYNTGALAINTTGNSPKVGQLINSAWNISDTCTFKVLTSAELKKLQAPLPTVTPMPSISKLELKDQPPSPSYSKPSTSTSQERIEMPPPPSPASSTCSEPGASPLPKRNKRLGGNGNSAGREEEKSVEETWNLKNIVFVEDSKNVCIGRVVKIDGNYAAVRFNGKESVVNDSMDVNSLLQECRLLKKDDLQLIKPGSSVRQPDCVQRQPRRVILADNGGLIKMTVSNQGIHAIVRNGNKLNYVIYNLVTGRPEQECSFPSDLNSFFGHDQSLIQLNCYGESDVIAFLRDGNGAFYPFAKDCNSSIKDPIQLNLPPVQSMGLGIVPVKDAQSGLVKNQVIMGLIFLENQILTPDILRSDAEMVRLSLASLEKDQLSPQSIVAERMDGNRNILHTAVCMCCPTSNKPINEQSNSSDDYQNDGIDLLGSVGKNVSSLQEMIKRSKQSKQSDRESSRDSEQQDMDAMNISSQQPSGSMPTLNWPPESHPDMPFFDPNEQKAAALSVLWALTESSVIRPFLKDLMCAKNSQGFTPFMLAVNGRAYTAALHLFDVAQRIANESSNQPEQRKKTLMSMIFPRGCNPDDSPLFLICYNDTCSFTWTGSEHINQDIFECTTCGLVESLCCCTECARICHRGHDCKLKRTSPTAYCDCWEKCKCKALIAGSQTARQQLLKRLMADTDLVTIPNGKGENILLFLVQTVGRQIFEQRQHRPNRARSSSKKQAELFTVAATDAETPDHDLEPPKFARRALDKILQDWNAVRAMILTGYRGDQTSLSGLASNLIRSNQSLSYRQAEEQTFIMSQNGTAFLDKFTHYLLLKVAGEMLDPLLITIIKQCSDPNSSVAKEARLVARRFVRSVARISVVLCIEMNPTGYQFLNTLNNNTSSGGSNSNWKKNSNQAQLQKCKRVFQALLPIAIEELCEMADSLIAPVRLGVSRPTSSFSLMSSLTEAINGSEELFLLDPLMSSSNVNGNNNNNNNNNNVNNNNTNNNEDERMDFQGDQSRKLEPNRLLADERVDVDIASPMGEDLDPLDQAADEVDASDLEPVDFADVVDNPVDESDSESDSNADDASYQSNVDNASAQRSATTGATVGSDAGIASLAYFSEDESGDSSNAEDEEESETAETELETEDINFMDESLERDRRSVQVSGNPPSSNAPTYSDVLSSAANGNANPPPSTSSINASQTRNNLAQHLQWALRHRDTVGSGAQSGRIGPNFFSNNNLIHFDPTNIRRSTSNVVPTQSLTTESISMATTAVSLARSFSIVMRQLAALLPLLQNGDRSSVPGINALALTFTEQVSIMNYVENRLRPTWDWLINVMDSTEGQLRFGCALTNATGNGGSAGQTGRNAGLCSFSLSTLQNVRSRLLRIDHRIPTLDRSTSGATGGRRQANLGRYGSHALADSNAGARRDFLQYAISLMRAHNNEHLDSLPTLDVGSLKHVAYVFDALVYYMKVNNESIAHNQQTGSSSSIRPSTVLLNSFGNSTSVLSSQLNASSVIPGQLAAAQLDAASFSADLEQDSMEDPEEDSALSCSVSFAGPNASTLSAPVELIGLDDSASNTASSSLLQNQNTTTTNTSYSSKGRKHPFFQRSNSTLFLGCPPSDPFSTPLVEALPLADQPHLLQPNSRREELFGIPRSTNCSEYDQQLFDSLPSRISLSDRTQFNNSGRRSEETQETSFATADSPQASGSGMTPLNFTGIGKATETQTSGQTVRSPIIVNPVLTSNKSSVIVHGSLIKQQTTSPSSSPMKHLSTTTNTITTAATNQLFSNSSLPKENVIRRSLTMGGIVQNDILLGRWRLTLELFGRVFVDDVGAEPGSIISELESFPLKEVKFRREMERLRNSQQRDLVLNKIERDRAALIQQTFKELNSMYSNFTRRFSSASPLMTVSRVKVTFKDEPGEGSGVARSFFTAFADAILSNERLPSLDNCQAGNRSLQYNLIQRLRSKEREREQQRRAYQGHGSRSSSNRDQLSGSRSSEISGQLRYDAPAFIMPDDQPQGSQLLNGVMHINEIISPHRQQLGMRLFSRVSQLRPSWANKITGMLLELPPASLLTLFASDAMLRNKVEEALDIIMSHRRDLAISNAQNGVNVLNASTLQSNNSSAVSQASVHGASSVHAQFQLMGGSQGAMQSQAGPSSGASSSASTSNSAPVGNQAGASGSSSANNQLILSAMQTADNLLDLDMFNLLHHRTAVGNQTSTTTVLDEEDDPEDLSPLFYLPGKRGFHSPRQGKCTPERLNAFRNVGRVLGLCLLLNELCPINLNRHVIKYILSKQIAWHDLAFFDPILYESLRQLILDAQSGKEAESLFGALDLRFAVDLCPEEGGGQVDLIPNGRNVVVNSQNVYDYVRKYASYRMVKSQEKALQCLRQGVFDVLPANALDTLTAEDFRLLLNGVNEINVQQLIEWTTFNEENVSSDPGDGGEHLPCLKKWFWSIVEKMTSQQKQDLVYFWTGSPALPASEEGFNPTPSITVRSLNDQYLPTANTCISKLYLPIYTSKANMRNKLLTAIKIKDFGFI